MKRKTTLKRNLKRVGGRRARQYIDEKAMVAVVVDILAERPGHAAGYPELRERIPTLVRLTAQDRRASPTRPGEEMWEQILRNIRSHINSHKEIVGIEGGLKLKQSAKKLKVA